MRYYLDLFAGIGGFALGAEWAGFEFDAHYFSEIDPYAIKVYQKRFPEAIALGDITKINGKELPNGEWIIAGGFPCQDISVAGKGVGLEGARSGLWYEYARIIGELRPRFAIMENVGALVSRGLASVLGSLASIGYDAEWQDIRASDVGAPHRRERIWIVAYPWAETDTSYSNSYSKRSYREKINFNGSIELRNEQIGEFGQMGEDVVNSDSERCQKQFDGITAGARDIDSEYGREDVADTTGFYAQGLGC